MDKLIASYSAQVDDDLMLCVSDGVAYQRDMTQLIDYTDDYARKFEAYDPSIVRRVNRARVEFIKQHVTSGTLIDVGAGDGEFVFHARRAGFDAKGLEVIPQLRKFLEGLGIHASDPRTFDIATFWDSLEHLENPDLLLGAVRRGAFVFASIPVFTDLQRIRESKHYRPGEHLYYFTRAGFAAWMGLRGFRLIGSSPHETDAGREAIGAFAFYRSILAP